MPNELKMAIVEAILRLHALQWSARRIARELGIDRGTVGRHLKQAQNSSKPAISPPGSPGSNAATFRASPGRPGEVDDSAGSAEGGCISSGLISPPGLEALQGAPLEQLPDAAENSTGVVELAPARVGRRSDCEPYREWIAAQLDQGLSAQRIYQDLVAEHGFAGSYDSVKRFVRRLGASTPPPFRRMECGPGEEAQVDFGRGAPVITAEGKRRNTWVFRIVLSHSRKAYSEVAYRQTTEDFIRCLENAVWHFGGATKTLVIDNLRAAVAHPDWFDPELVPKLASFCRHYGTVILPTRPYMPRHKGKVESGVKYVKNNALKGRRFASLAAQNEHLQHWEATIADTRIHGTTKQQVGKVYLESERSHLLPLPLQRFEFFHEAQRKVSRDGHVEVAKAFYSAPPEYLGRTVWARWDARLVRIFNQRLEQIAIHVRREHGQFSTLSEHVVPEKISGLERGAEHLLKRARAVGPHSHRWSQAMVTARGIAGTRVLQGLLALAKKHSSKSLENACETALSYGCYRLRTIRKLLDRQAEQQQPLPFLDEHPIIRPLDDYASIVAQAIRRREDRSSMSEGFERHGWAEAMAERAHQKSPHTPSPAHPGPAESLPPRPGYPSSGCTSAEPDSVSPDTGSVVRD
jgi:transposase